MERDLLACVTLREQTHEELTKRGGVRAMQRSGSVCHLSSSSVLFFLSFLFAVLASTDPSPPPFSASLVPSTVAEHADDGEDVHRNEE